MDHLLLRLPGDTHWVHDLSPWLLHISGPIGIRWYGLAYLAGIAWGFWMLRRWTRAGRVPLRENQLADFVLSAGLGMIIGGRLGYCLFYAFDQVAANPLFVFKLWEGGMASHGGIIGLIVGTWLYTRKAKVSFAVMGDIVAATGPMGVGLGRIANFINGELWGKPIGDAAAAGATGVPWAVVFPGAPAIEVPPGSFQFFDVPRHPSQLYEAGLEGLATLIVVLLVHRAHRRPGLTVAVFFIAYGVARFVSEFFREPDAGQPGAAGVPAILGFMSKGQALTIPFFALGLVWLLWLLRRPARPEAYVVPADPVSSAQHPPASTVA